MIHADVPHPIIYSLTKGLECSTSRFSIFLGPRLQQIDPRQLVLYRSSMATIPLAFAFGAMATTSAMTAGYLVEFLMIVMVVWLSCTLWFRGTTTQNDVAEAVCKKPVRQRHVGIQCDLGPVAMETHSYHTAPGNIYTAPSGNRWHAQRTCRHLKLCSKIHEYSVCLTCSAAECG